MVYQREDNESMREKQPVLDWIVDRLVLNPITSALVSFFAAKKWLHRYRTRAHAAKKKYFSHRSTLDIPEFMDFYDIDLNEFEIQHPLGYRSFHDFLTRKVRPGMRVPEAVPNSIASVADGRLSFPPSMAEVCGAVASTGMGGIVDLTPFAFGTFAHFRLTPQDYHHIHSPLACTVRSVVQSTHDDGGAIVLVGDGVTCLIVTLGAMALTVEAGDVLSKGDEMGCFQSDAADVFLLVDRRVLWDDDITYYTDHGIETLVRATTTIGTLAQV